MNIETTERNEVIATLPEHEAAPGFAVSLGVVVSEGEHWVEDDVHVLRSTEFDVIAGDPDFDTAVDKFIDMHEDLWVYLSGVDELTDNENETFLKLAPRFLAIHQELERREKERRRRAVSINIRALRRLLRNGSSLADWRQQEPSTQAHSSQPSVA